MEKYVQIFRRYLDARYPRKHRLGSWLLILNTSMLLTFDLGIFAEECKTYPVFSIKSFENSPQTQPYQYSSLTQTMTGSYLCK